MSEIASVSQEQAKGIQQVNFAIATIDNVNQQTTCNAQEYANTSDEMSLQAEHMRASVELLTAIVKGRKR